MKIKLNPDKEIIELARSQFRENGGYCPCVLPQFRNPDTKCRCKTFQQQIDAGIEGECHCGIFIAVKE